MLTTNLPLATMQALVVTASAFLPNGIMLSQLNENYKSHSVPVKSRSLCRSRKKLDADGVFKASSQIGDDVRDNAEVSQERFQPSNFEVDARKSDIWKLFKEAQQNILYLNKQRLLAAEELDKAKRENQLLLDRIEKLEAEHRSIKEPENQLMHMELVLRIDSMILTGMINTAEASCLRKLVMGFNFRVAEVFFKIMDKSDVELLQELRLFSDGSKKNAFHIVHICSEMAPLVSVGSLASYVTGLSKALQRRGHFVEVILPKYSILDLKEVRGLREIKAESYSYFSGQLHGNRIWTGVVHGIAVTFIQPLYYSSFFNRERVYGYTDDFERFTYFSRASLDYIAKSGRQPDVLHIHNWETAIVGPLFWDIFVKQGLGATRMLLTCHQLDSRCLTQPDKLALCGLDPARLHRLDRLQDDIETHLVNILKGGIVYSNKVIIVWPTISKEKIISSSSHGLESTLTIHKDKLLVTPYGVDNSIWDPSKDKLIPKNYSPDDMKGKAACRVALQQRLALSLNSSSVLVGCIFTESTDIDMENLKAIVQNAIKKSAQFIFLGSKMPTINGLLDSLQKGIKDEAVRFVNEDDEALSHVIFAGADIILCQSFNDPMHQVAVKALKYGAAPIAMSTNVNKLRHSAGHDQEEAKFLQFINSTFGYMSLSEALNEIKNNPSKWKQKITAAMSRDFSWDAECCDIHVAAYTALKNL